MNKASVASRFELIVRRKSGRSRKMKGAGVRALVGPSGRSPVAKSSVKTAIRRDEVQILHKANAILDNGTLWLQSPNSQFGGKKPIDLVRNGLKAKVSDALDAIKFGMFS